MYTMCMYYSIVHTRHIHVSDLYVHVYARWVGFQMTGISIAARARLNCPTVIDGHTAVPAGSVGNGAFSCHTENATRHWQLEAETEPVQYRDQCQWPAAVALLTGIMMP
jgi:hypothetical protein